MSVQQTGRDAADFKGTPEEFTQRLQANVQRPQLEWPEPKPLPEARRLEYPVDALPSGLREAVHDVQHSSQAPYGLVATAAISVLSAAVQGLCNVGRDSTMVGPASLFTLTINASGERKSHCEKLFMQPLNEWQAEQLENALPGMARRAAEVESWKAKADGIKSKIKQLARAGKATRAEEERLVEHEEQKPGRFVYPRLAYSDPTPEALGLELATGWPSGALISAEGGALLGGHGMSSESMMRTLALFNLLWDGATHTVDRRTTDSYTIRGARLTIGMQVQPGTLRRFIEKGGNLARENGFFARCLVAEPESTQGARFYREPSDLTKLNAHNRRIRQLLEMPPALDESDRISPDTLWFSPEAKAEWISFYNDLERAVGKGQEFQGATDLTNKSAENIARLAAIFSIYAGEFDQIRREAVTSAGAIVVWHAYESLRWFGPQDRPGRTDAILLEEWLLRQTLSSPSAKVTRTVLAQKGPNKLREHPDRRSAALSLLESLNRIRIENTQILVNPGLLPCKD